MSLSTDTSTTDQKIADLRAILSLPPDQIRARVRARARTAARSEAGAKAGSRPARSQCRMEAARQTGFAWPSCVEAGSQAARRWSALGRKR